MRSFSNWMPLLLAGAGLSAVAALHAGLVPAEGWGLLLGKVPVVALYHRLHRDAALENPVRARLYEVVARRPGITIQDSAEEAGIARTTAAYHLRILGREGLLVERPSRKTVHYYRNDGRFTEEQQLRLQALASVRTRNVAQILVDRPGIQRSELAHLLGISIATVNWHLRPLAERGMLREELRGRRRLLFPTQALTDALSLLAPDRPADPMGARSGMPPAAGSSAPAPAPGLPQAPPASELSAQVEALPPPASSGPRTWPPAL